MGQNSARLDREKMGEMGEDATKKKMNMPRTINLDQAVLEMIYIHVFGSLSLLGTCAVAYAVIRQPARTKQGLI